MHPQTLFALSGRQPTPAPLEDAVLILIDYQNVYLSGPLALAGVDQALHAASTLLAAARKVGTRIIHVAHRGAAGGLFDREQPRGAIIDAMRPESGEVIIEKPRPNAFSGTELTACVGPAGTRIIVAGFMTHNCVSSTVRAALDLGYSVTLAGDACATRDLPFEAGVMPASELHRAVLAGLADMHACVVTASDLVDSAGCTGNR